MFSRVRIWTDGSCSGNPGPAGWAAILVSGNHEKEVVGGATESTNNRAEIMAVIVGLQTLKRSCQVTVITDSQYVIGVLDLGWKRKANHDLLAKADALMAKYAVSFEKVKGHSGNAMNERCDRLAKAEVERQRSDLVMQQVKDDIAKEFEALKEYGVRQRLQVYPPLDSDTCDRCYKRMVGEELQRSRERSEFIAYCDSCFENHGAWR